MYLDKNKCKQSEREYICKYCLLKLKNNEMPPTCILNNFDSGNTPIEITELNMYENILIQRAKSFQVIQSMETVSKKKVPSTQIFKKIKGRTFHLPMPLEQTLNKLPVPTDPINFNHELFIIVRSVPTAKKVIWENIVDIQKVYKALVWLKKIIIYIN